MRYVVTGGAGFIGSHLVEHLVGGGHHVTVLDDFSSGKRANIAKWLDRIALVEGSITDPATCARAIDGADFVLHEAAVPVGAEVGERSGHVARGERHGHAERAHRVARRAK